MTCKEKLKAEHPEFVSIMNIGGCKSCPQTYGYLPKPDHCGDAKNGEEAIENCTKCWDREIPETPTKEKTVNEQREEQGLEPVFDPQYIQTGVILDSGNRTQFETGAVRDMREGKGRCDLMPLAVVSTLLSHQANFNKPIDCIREFQTSGYTAPLYQAIHFFLGLNRDWDCVYTMFLEVSKHFEEGAKKYGENNWQKGIPVHCYIDSAVRHYLKWLRGDKDEPHDRAFVWNLMCCIWEVDYRPKDTHEFLKKELHVPNQDK